MLYFFPAFFTLLGLDLTSVQLPVDEALRVADALATWARNSASIFPKAAVRMVVSCGLASDEGVGAVGYSWLQIVGPTSCSRDSMWPSVLFPDIS